MELVFEIISYHRLSPEQLSQKVVRESMTFGRSEKSDWHLPDPEKVVSNTHGRIEKTAQGFVLYDLSTNGLYINRAVEALGIDNHYLLMDGDLLAFGDYEITVKLLTQQGAQSNDPEPETATTQVIPQVNGIIASRLFDDSVESRPKSRPLIPSVTNDLNDHFIPPQLAIP